jgi:hypothetical protein
MNINNKRRLVVLYHPAFDSKSSCSKTTRICMYYELLLAYHSVPHKRCRKAKVKKKKNNFHRPLFSFICNKILFSFFSFYSPFSLLLFKNCIIFTSLLFSTIRSMNHSLSFQDVTSHQALSGPLLINLTIYIVARTA